MRTILITGTSSGIGRAIAERLLKQGHRVIGLARRSQADHPFRDLPFHPIIADLSGLDQLEPLCKELKHSFPEIDAIICNAGQGLFGHLEQLSIEDIHDLFDINFFSHVHLVKSFLPFLKQKTHADLLFLGSEAALAGKRKGSIYCASKFALRGFAQALREECAAGSVRVCMIQPGMVRSSFFDDLDFFPGEDESHALSPQDIADAVDMILHLRPGAVCEEIFLSPHKKVIRFLEKVQKN